jgi:hypothetical protein
MIWLDMHINIWGHSHLCVEAELTAASKGRFTGMNMVTGTPFKAEGSCAASSETNIMMVAGYSLCSYKTAIAGHLTRVHLGRAQLNVQMASTAETPACVLTALCCAAAAAFAVLLAQIQSVKQRVPTTSGKRYQTMTMTDTIEMSYQEVACHMHMIASCSSMGGGSMHMLEN